MRRLPCGGLLFLALIALPGAALAANAKPVTPADGATVRVTPPAGFANGDAKLTWSVNYPDCPGPDSIHSSYPEVRVARGSWSAEQRGGPFLGNGTFSAPTSLYPGKTPVKVQWRVFWACGATGDFAGSQGRSPTVSFTLQPISACTGLTGRSKTRCMAGETRDAALATCAAIKAKAQRDTCTKKARDAYAKAIR